MLAESTCETVTFTPGRSILFLSTLLQTNGITQCMALQGDVGNGSISAWAVLLLSLLTMDIQQGKPQPWAQLHLPGLFFFIFSLCHLTSLDF